MNNRTHKLFWLCVFAAFVMTGCKKTEYLTDGGTHNPVTPLSNYDYLQQNQWQLFDTLLQVIDHYNLKEEVNSAGTFFASTDYSIARFIKLKDDSVKRINENFTYTLDDMYHDISGDSIRQYMFTDKIDLTNTNDQVTPYNSKANTSMGIQKFLQTDPSFYQWGSTPVYSLFLVKIRGSLDDPSNPLPPNDPDVDGRSLCQTSGIGTSSGTTVLHALSNTHVFVRF